MSNSHFDRIYVSDIDGYISIDGINAANEAAEKEEALRESFDELGTIELLAGVTTKGTMLRSAGIGVDDWKWEIAQAEKRLRDLSDKAIEPTLLKDLLALGRAYAIGRYAHSERLSRETAKAAALPYGIQALLHKFFLSSGLRPSAEIKKQFLNLFNDLRRRSDITAYEKTGHVQKKLHALAETAWGSRGALELDRSETREILSLVRLYFSVSEPTYMSFARVRDLEDLYLAWSEEVSSLEYGLLPGRTFIQGWAQRHIVPLNYFYPIEIRAALARGAEHSRTDRGQISRRIAMNELALANCSIPLIKTAARGGTSRPVVPAADNSANTGMAM